MVCRNELVCRLKWHDNNSLHQIGAFGIVNLVFWGMIAYSQNVIVMILYNQTEISFSLFLLKSKEGIRKKFELEWKYEIVNVSQVLLSINLIWLMNAQSVSLFHEWFKGL